MAERESGFIRFLLHASQKQARLLLGHLTPRQLEAIGEICYNILHSQLDPALQQSLRTHRRLIRLIANRQLSSSQRNRIIRRHTKAVLRILHFAESLLP